jgi:hypothetical protein
MCTFVELRRGDLDGGKSMAHDVLGMDWLCVVWESDLTLVMFA